MIERRFIRGGELRAKSGDKPGIAGVASVYNQQYDMGYMVETIKPGAFNKVLGADPDVRCLFNHDPNNLLGRTKSGTLRLNDSKDGLQFECDVDMESRCGADVQRMIERGDLDGCSFGFTVGKQSWREEKDGNEVRYYRDIEEIDELFDVGPVTYPAYTGTSVAARSALWPQGIPAEVRSHIPTLQAEEKPAPVAPEKRDVEDGDGPCDCPCASCMDGDCSGCDCEGCDSETCGNQDCRCDSEAMDRSRAMRLRIAEASL
jgi:hypothetical protein